jgi:protein SCO1/2
MRRLLLVLAAILALVLGYLHMQRGPVTNGASQAPAARTGQDGALKSGEFTPAAPAPDFSLAGSNGRPIKLSDYRGKVVALGFGFTSCPQICPTTLLQLAEVRKKLGAEGADFQVIYITVDPARDTAVRMRDYVTGFDASFMGATGSAAELAEVRKLYGATSSEVRGQDGQVLGFNHTSSVFLIDRSGRLRSMSPYGRAVDDVVHDVRILLKG